MSRKASDFGLRRELGSDISPEALGELVLETIPGIFYLVDQKRQMRLWNARLEQVTGYGRAQLDGLDALDFFDESLHPEVLAAITECFEKGWAVADIPMRVRNGESQPFQFHGRRVEVAGETLMAGVALDASELKESQEERQRQREQLERLALHVPGMIFQLKRDGGTGKFSLPYASAKIREVFGVNHDEVAEDAGSLFERVHGDDIERVMAAVEASADALTPFYQQFRMCPAGGAVCTRDSMDWVEVDSGPERLVDGSVVWHGFARLVTERKNLEQKLTRLAYFDKLTGLPNRAQLQSILEDELAQASANREGLAVLYVDLNSFNDINDAWGHAAGDRLLRQLADRLRKAIGPDEVLGRIGGDEFLLVVRGDGVVWRAEALASRIARAMEAPLNLQERQVRVTISTGISMFPDDARTGDDLIRQADAALYRAKALGPGRWAHYTPELTEAARARRYLETELRSAIEHGQIGVALQPVVSLTDDRVVAVEALARWHHPEDGWVAPDRFVPLAEKRGLIEILGEQVWRQAMKAVAAMPGDVGLTINVTPGQIDDPAFCRRVAELAGNCGLELARLEVEITERAFMAESVEPLEQIEQLREHCISVAIDDFGAGFSSLSYLRRLPVQRLKIDRSFVRGIERDHANAAIVRAVSTLARDLGMQVTAEGVETKAEAEFVRQAGCDCAQGWYFGSPVLVET